jgi:hypothetical protein
MGWWEEIRQLRNHDRVLAVARQIWTSSNLEKVSETREVFAAGEEEKGKI